MPTTPRDPTNLSSGALDILTSVLQVMQDAEELGGVRDSDDYIALMNRISEEATARAGRCLATYTHRIESGGTVVFSGPLRACEKYLDDCMGVDMGWVIVPIPSTQTEPRC